MPYLHLLRPRVFKRETGDRVRDNIVKMTRILWPDRFVLHIVLLVLIHFIFGNFILRWYVSSRLLFLELESFHVLHCNPKSLLLLHGTFCLDELQFG